MDFNAIFLQYWPDLVSGALMTLRLAVTATVLGAIIALPLAIIRANGNRAGRSVVAVFVSFLRGTPMLAQLFLIYYGSGQFRAELQDLGLWSYFREPMFCALLTFTLNTAAYQTEILRGGIRSVPRGEVEAGSAIGMSRMTLYRRVVLPHAYRISLPALGNEFVLMVKGSAIASVVTILDLLGTTRLIFSRTFDFSIYLQAAIVYLVISYGISRLWRLLEHTMTPQYRRPRVSVAMEK